MFDLWLLNRRRRLAYKAMKAKLKNVDARSDHGMDEIVNAGRELIQEMDRLQDLTEMHLTRTLCDEATRSYNS